MNKLERLALLGIVGIAGLTSGCATDITTLGQKPEPRQIFSSLNSKYENRTRPESESQPAIDINFFGDRYHDDRFRATIDNVAYLLDAHLGEGERGIKIYSDVTLFNLKGIDVQANACFYNFDKVPMKDKDGKYCTSTGKICARTDIVPSSDKESYRRWAITIPKSQIIESLEHGVNDIYFVIKVGAVIEGKPVFLGESDYVSTAYMGAKEKK